MMQDGDVGERPTVLTDDPANSWADFSARFAGDEACRQLLISVRWPGGYSCEQCGGVGEPWLLSRGRIRCRRCRYTIGVTKGTLFEDTRLPLHTWYAVMWLVCQKTGVSAKGLQRVLEISYKSAWECLRKLRECMAHKKAPKLQGRIEMGVVALTGRAASPALRVHIAVEQKGRKVGRIGMAPADEQGDPVDVSFVERVAAPGATIVSLTTVHRDRLVQAGFMHEIASAEGSGRTGQLVAVKTVGGLVKRWLLGTHQGGVQLPYLASYLDEFAFRFNRRGVSGPGVVFLDLLKECLGKEDRTAG
jgi:hypothetical protein